MSGPKLRNDCFAMPPGVDWTPVEEALARLDAGLIAVAKLETLDLQAAGGRFLGEDVFAPRNHPPYANAAVDGYGFAAESLSVSETQSLPLHAGRAAAGVPFDGKVPAGKAIRILTGAALPVGVDTVVLEEDCEVNSDTLTFGKGLKRGANARPMGEDIKEGDLLLTKGTKLGSGEIAMLASVGVSKLAVHRPLRVGVLSTGDEVVEVGQAAKAHQIYDANRPMLLSLIERWGMEAIDLGHAADTRAAVTSALDIGADTADAILTSGGASAGDEDHISQALQGHGALQTWRIAVKPGRPLALGLWNGVPVFGLPGNPVAAFVCSLVFARPALLKLAGGSFERPVGHMVPAAFSKSKKQGRREFLRARLNPAGQVENFASEGSGRVSGLAWADGLVELMDEGQEIALGDPVRYIPFTAFGL